MVKGSELIHPLMPWISWATEPTSPGRALVSLELSSPVDNVTEEVSPPKEPTSGTGVGGVGATLSLPQAATSAKKAVIKSAPTINRLGEWPWFSMDSFQYSGTGYKIYYAESADWD